MDLKQVVLAESDYLGGAGAVRQCPVVVQQVDASAQEVNPEVNPLRSCTKARHRRLPCSGRLVPRPKNRHLPADGGAGSICVGLSPPRRLRVGVGAAKDV